jgi:ribokinase
VIDHAEMVHAPGFVVDAVDSTGAGDAFVGSLAVFLAEGASMKDAVRRANAVAALSVTRIGTQVSFPQQAEVNAFLSSLHLIAGDRPEGGGSGLSRS